MSDSIDVIRDSVDRVIATKEFDSFVTFTIVDHQSSWLQFNGGGEINTAYPFSEAPNRPGSILDALDIHAWTPNGYLHGNPGLADSYAIARWINQYFVEILQASEGYELTAVFEL